MSITKLDLGIVYCTCGHLLRKGREENKKFVQYTMDFFSISNSLHKERTTPRAPLREETSGSRVFHREFAPQECKKKFFLGIHDQIIRDEKFRKNMFDVGRSEELCREMDKLANEDHTHQDQLYKTQQILRAFIHGSKQALSQVISSESFQKQVHSYGHFVLVRGSGARSLKPQIRRRHRCGLEQGFHISGTIVVFESLSLFRAQF